MSADPRPTARPTPSRADELSTALEDVLDGFAGRLRAIARRHGLDDADVDDVQQAVRIRLWRAVAEPAGGAPGEAIRRLPASYLYRAATTAVLELLRGRGRRQRHQRPLDEAAPDLPASQRADDALGGRELAAALGRALEAVTPSRRAVVRMYLAGYERREIVTLLREPDTVVRNLLHRGLAELRAALAREGYRP